MTTDKNQIPARVRKLEQKKPDELHEIRVIWGNPGEPKPQPGEWLIEWGQNDEITRRRVKEGENKQNANQKHP